MSARRIVFGGLVLVAVLLVASPAFAAAPTVVPETLAGPYSFDTTVAPFATAGTFLAGNPDPTAWWGRVTTRYYSSSGGLWCAGSVNAAPAATALYPSGTAGSATLALPDMANWYSATFSFRYSWPDYSPYKVSPYDFNGFSVAWQEMGVAHIVNQIDWSMPKQAVSNTWTLWSEDLSKASNSVVLSRRPGKVIFDFTDDVGSFGDNPATNLGPTVDDVAVKGYTYGPVRDLNAALGTPSGVYTVTLSWSRPASSTTDARDDTRPKRFRVWRDDGSTSSAVFLGDVDDPGTGPLSFVDQPGSYTQDWKYYVQAIDQGPGAPVHWGQLASPLLVTKQVVPTTSRSVSPLNPGASGWYVTPPTISLVADVSGSKTYYRIDSGSWQLYLAPIQLTEGNHTVYYYSENQLGLAETQKQAGPFKVDTIVPDKPTPSIADVTQTSMSITWPSVTDPGPESSGVSGYRVYTDQGALLATVPSGSGTIAYAPTNLVPATSYTFKILTVDTAGNPLSEQFPLLRAASVSARTKDPLLTSVVATIPAGRLVAYNGPTVVTADLAYSGGTYLADRKASLKVYTSTAGPTGPWTATSYPFTDLGLGRYIATVYTTTKTWYQVRFVATGPYAASNSTATMLIQARASLSRPTVPTTTYHTKTTTLYGKLYPKHVGTTRIYFEHWEAYKGKYQYRLKFYKTASLSAASTYEKYSVALKLPYTGKWRVRAWHGDASHYPTYTTYSYTTVR